MSKLSTQLAEAATDAPQEKVVVQVTVNNHYEGEEVNEFIARVDGLAMKLGFAYEGNSSGGGTAELGYRGPAGSAPAFIANVQNLGGAKRWSHIFVEAETVEDLGEDDPGTDQEGFFKGFPVGT